MVQGREEVRRGGFATLDDRDVLALVERLRLILEHSAQLVARRVEPVVWRCVVLDELRDEPGLGDPAQERVAEVLGRPRRTVPEELTSALFAGGAVKQKEIIVCVLSSFLFPHFISLSLGCFRASTPFSLLGGLRAAVFVRAHRFFSLTGVRTGPSLFFARTHNHVWVVKMTL